MSGGKSCIIQAAVRLIILLLLLGIHLRISSCVGGHKTLCRDEERRALLKFKASLHCEYDNVLSSWTSGKSHRECCQWGAVTCDNVTGHVTSLDFSNSIPAVHRGNISSSLLELKHLNHLDLSAVNFYGNRVPSFLGKMTSLTFLSLLGTQLEGPIPEALGNLTSLEHLDLGENFFEGPIPKSFINLTSLTYLNLGHGVQGSIPQAFGNYLTGLTYLDLSRNILSGSIPKSFGNMTSLTYLDLRSNQLAGSIPETLGNLTALVALHLDDNQLAGEIPRSVWNICTLRSLELSGNKLTGQFPDVTPGSCLQHPLEDLYAIQNSITGPFPNLTLFSSLERLFLSSNRLNGGVHQSIGGLSHLEDLDLFDNLLEGVITEAHFLKLSSLKHLDLSLNRLSFQVSSTWDPPFQLTDIYLASCELGPRFPTWLQTQREFYFLDISNVRISDFMPIWFWEISKYSVLVNISNNQIRGAVANFALDLDYSVKEIDLSSNQLEGQVPLFLFNVTMLLLSRNKFSSMSSLCGHTGEKELAFLDISLNRLSGKLSNCWKPFKDLKVLNLADNYELAGEIPTTFGYLTSLRALLLANNKFVGEVPLQLKNCKELVVVDVGGNQLRGQIPAWLGERLQNLVILGLRSNHFNGSIPWNLCHLQLLQVLDLSINHISGSIPRCVSDITAMRRISVGDTTISHEDFGLPYFPMGKLSYSYTDKLELTWKGKLSVYENTLGLVKSIDLSCNMLHGEIPRGIVELVGLVSLNLSGNNISGQIPSEIGRLRSLDVLDLSDNHLSGHIPTSVALIDRLSVLDLSNNNLSGKIPTGTQLQSFNLAYLGNPGLCGDPLPQKCPGDHHTEQAADQEDIDDRFITQGFYVSMGVGFAVGFWGVCATLFFNKACRYAFFMFLKDFNDWIYVMAMVHKAKLLRRTATR